MQSLLLSGVSLAETSLSCRGLRLCLLPGWSGTLLIFLFLVPLGSSLYLDFFFFLVASPFTQKRMCFIYPTFLRGMFQEMFILMISETYDSSYFNKDSIIKTILHWVATHI